MFNPFDLRGPEFLIFYLFLGFLTVFISGKWIKRSDGNGPMPKLNLTDPYEIAFLRGGKNEALRIAVLSLVDRQLIEANGTQLKSTRSEAQTMVQRRIERALLSVLKTAQEVSQIFSDRTLSLVAEEYRSSLGKNRLVATPAVYASRRPAFLAGLAVLLGVAGYKINLAIARGHSNVLFLVLLAIAFSWSLHSRYARARTVLGDRALSDLMTLFARLKDRTDLIRAGGATNEAALLAAVFGISALSPVHFSYVNELFARRTAANGLGAGVDCGSSCGSVSSCSSSSCGSSCGGGGGCGGCGS